jgi:hypothetical protein
MDEQKRLKQKMEALRKNPIDTSKRHIHLLFDHYLIWVKDRNTYVVNGGQRGAEEFESKVNELIGKVIELQQEKHHE